jgi:hypothetical protein
MSAFVYINAVMQSLYFNERIFTLTETLNSINRINFLIILFIFGVFSSPNILLFTARIAVSFGLNITDGSVV